MNKSNKHMGKRTESVAQVRNKKDYSRLKYDHIDVLCLEAKKYNELHNTNYSYGEYTEKKRDGKLEYSPPIIDNPPKNESTPKTTKSK